MRQKYYHAEAHAPWNHTHEKSAEK